MLFTEENTRANIRSRDGKRVLFVGREDTLTPGARDWLRRERIEILPREAEQVGQYQLENGGYMDRKPEYMTHLQGTLLVRKDHPRIRFRGKMDSLQAALLLCQEKIPELRQELGQMLALSRRILRCEVMGEPLAEEKLCGLTAEQLRGHSHRPQDHYGQGHFMPQWTDGPEILELNRLRCAIRDTERSAVAAFVGEDGRTDREDILRALNRMSSMAYILMIRAKRERCGDGEHGTDRPGGLRTDLY